MSGSVVHRGRIAVAFLMLESSRNGFRLRAIAVERMAGIAGNLLVGREPRIVIENPAQVYLGLGYGIIGRSHHRGQRLKHLQRVGIHLHLAGCGEQICNRHNQNCQEQSKSSHAR